MTAVSVQLTHRPRPKSRLPAIPWAWITFAIILLVWQAASVAFQIPGYLLPSPASILAVILKNWSMLIAQSWITIFEILAGFAISVAVGVPLAICVSYSRVLDRAVYPLIVGSQTIPKVAIAPLLLAWFGYGLTPKITIVVLVAFFPIMINAVVGLRSAPPHILHLARSMGASNIQIFWLFRLPQALPSIFAGMKLATVLAVIGAIVAEFVGAESGLGYLIMVSGANFDIASQFAAIFLLSIIGTLFFAAIAKAERLCLPWHISVRSEHGA